MARIETSGMGLWLKSRPSNLQGNQMLINARPDSAQSVPENKSLDMMEMVETVTGALRGLCDMCEYRGEGCDGAAEGQVWKLAESRLFGVQHIETNVRVDDGFNPAHYLPCE